MNGRNKLECFHFPASCKLTLWGLVGPFAVYEENLRLAFGALLGDNVDKLETQQKKNRNDPISVTPPKVAKASILVPMSGVTVASIIVLTFANGNTA